MNHLSVLPPVAAQSNPFLLVLTGSFATHPTTTAASITSPASGRPEPPISVSFSFLAKKLNEYEPVGVRRAVCARFGVVGVGTTTAPSFSGTPPLLSTIESTRAYRLRA